MKNNLFTQKTAKEKRSRLAAILQSKSYGTLDDAIIKRILPNVSIHKQYTISTFTDRLEFQEAVARTQIACVLLAMIFSRKVNSPAAAVITPMKTANPKNNRWSIFLYVPNQKHRKGVRRWADSPKIGSFLKF